MTKTLRARLLTVAILVTVFSSCKLQRNITIDDLKGHWYVFEQRAGYLEFSIDSNEMFVCSPKYNRLYKGQIEINKNDLIQYEESDPGLVRIKGEIIGFYGDTLVLQYDDSKEYCVRLSPKIPLKVNAHSCFMGAQRRLDSLLND